MQKNNRSHKTIAFLWVVHVYINKSKCSPKSNRTCTCKTVGEKSFWKNNIFLGLWCWHVALRLSNGKKRSNKINSAPSPGVYAFGFDHWASHRRISSHKWHWTSLGHQDEIHQICSSHLSPTSNLQKAKHQRQCKILQDCSKTIGNLTK